jgi:trans-4-hydroxy-L-proline dehydratase
MMKIKETRNLSRRIQFLRDYYFSGTERSWNNQQISFSTGTGWDVLYNECNYHIVPETYAFFQTFTSSYRQIAVPVDLCEGFWNMSLPQRRAWFNKEVMTQYLPREILPGDLIAGGRFNIHTSLCLTEKETKARAAELYGKKGLRRAAIGFHNHGFGNAGPTAGHLIPDYPRILKIGFEGVAEEIRELLDALPPAEQKGPQGRQLQAMLTACSMPVEIARAYREEIARLLQEETEPQRIRELEAMDANLSRVPEKGARNFWEAVQSLWLTHMLVMSDENYPGPGVSFGRLDQILQPFWEVSRDEGMDREFAKEILKCFWIHANTAYDSMIRVGNQGITAGFGQLFNISGLGPGGQDMTNEMTWILLEVIDEMSPILEPKPNVRLHRRSPDELLEKVVDMIISSQGAPFLLNFDERSMAGMMRQGLRSGGDEFINPDTVHDYASVGCLENTMCGNDRSGTVDCNLNLLKAVELVLGNGYPLIPFTDAITGATEKIKRQGPSTGDPGSFSSFDEFWKAFEKQIRFLIQKIVGLYDRGDSLRARFHPTPYLSTLVRGCAEKGLDITRGGAELNFVTIEGVTFATTVDSLLAVKYLVFDKSYCTMEELVRALKDNWKGHEALQARAKHKAPKYGRDDDEADALAKRVMDLWAEECWNYRTSETGRQFRPGMLSWNYWVGDGFILPASPDGRPKDQFLSNAICPSNGADTKGPTANSNSVGTVLGGRGEGGDWEDYFNCLPNGASHTISFNPALVTKPENREKFKAFLKGYAEKGGTALQINILDPEVLKEAQVKPRDYRHLLVRVTGYNAYFTSIGKELQDEVIARIAHEQI